MIMLPDDSAVQFEAVSKSYSKQKVVDNLHLSIPRGTILGLIGPNGAGKSTSLKALMGLVKVDSGTVRLFGHDVAEIRKNDAYGQLRQRVGYVPEVHNVYRWMRVHDAIRFVRSFYDHWNEKLEKELLDVFALDPKKKVQQLSKGMLAKLSLLLAIAHEPELLILDEPTSGLDPMVREEFLHGILKTVGDQERTIIFSSHSIGDVERLADTVSVLKSGKLMLCEPVDQVLEKTKRLTVTLRHDSTPRWIPPSTIWQQVDRREWELTVSDFSTELLNELKVKNEVERARVGDLSLEDIFKDYVRPRISVLEQTS